MADGMLRTVRGSQRANDVGYRLSDRRGEETRRLAGDNRSHSLPFTLSSFLPFLLLLPLLLGGCGVKLFGSGEAPIAAHTVFLTHDGCPTFVAQTLREGMALIENDDAAYTPTTGDVLEGPARVGPSVFRIFDGMESTLREGGQSVPLNVLAVNLTMLDARRRFDAACE